jgi:hypothetical protein
MEIRVRGDVLITTKNELTPVEIKITSSSGAKIFVAGGESQFTGSKEGRGSRVGGAIRRSIVFSRP